MEFNSGVSMILPDSIGLIQHDFDDEDHEDIVHEQTNQNEIVELIMAAFQGHDEPSDDDDDDDESSNTSDSSSDEQQLLNTNNNNNNNHTDEQYVQQKPELLHHNHSHQQTLFSTSPPLVPLNDIRAFEITKNETHLSFNPQNQLVHYQTNARLSPNTPPTAVHYVPTIDTNDPQQVEYFYQTSSTNLTETQNQLNRLRILCNVKDRKACQLQNLCEEYQEKYENDTRTFKHKLESSERSKYDLEQRYQSINRQCEELIETNNQLHRTIKDSELRIQQLEAVKIQFEKKFSDSESLIESLHRKLNEYEQFETIPRSQQNYELILSTTKEKYEQEIVSFNEKLQNIQMNLQEKNIEADELRVQLEIANKNNGKAIFERIETINHLNEQLHDCQRKYTDLLTTTSLESLNHTELKRQLTHMTEDKTKLESKCQELQSEIRTIRERFNENENEVNNAIFSIKSLPIIDNDSLENSVLDETIINENILLKERINEYVYKEKELREINDELKHKIHEYEHQIKRSDSSSSSSGSSNETVITTSVHMEQIRKLTYQIEKLKKDYTDLKDKYDYEKQELHTIIEQLREDVNDLDKTKQLYIDVCQEKNSIEDTLRSKFEDEFKLKFDELEKDYNEKILLYNRNQDIFEQDKQIIQRKYNQDLEQQSKELYQEIDRIKIKHEKQIMELNNELDRFRTDDDAKNRLVYIEKEFEQLKHDYYNLNLKQSELLKTCSTLENENENLLNSFEQIQNEKLHLTQTFENEIKNLNEHHKQELLSLHKQTDHKKINFQDNIQSLEIRINNYENIISQYEEYRIKLENNLQKITQQRDTNKVELRLTKEMLTNKENDYNQLKLHFEQCEKHLQNYQDQFRQYETTINDLERQITQYELNQTRLTNIQETELEYREKLMSIDAEKSEVEQRLEEANRALDLADSHLKQEIEKIKISLEQEYNHLYERDQKKHQQDLYQLRQQLTNEFNKQRSNSPSNNSLQDIEEIHKMYRIEIDRLYCENLELNQHQSKLIDAHQKQMQNMKKELDDGYNKVINEFQHEQTRLQTRCDQLKQQLNDSQQIIEQLKQNLNQFKTNHYDDISRIHEYGNRNRQDNLQNRLENLVKLLEQSNDALNQERIINAKKENEYQQTINSLQKKISEINKQHTKSMDEMQREHLTYPKRITPRPISVPDFSSSDLSSKEMTTIEKLRELFTNEMIALLQLTCKMIFDVHHRVIAAHYMDHLDMLMKKQIQNELIRSRNSMIKEIRREIFEKMTYALRSQGVPDSTIDLQIFELDRLLSQMVQDCLNSLPLTSLPVSNTSVLSLQITPQHHQSRSNISNSSSPLNKSTVPLKKSIECLYMTPSINKQRAPIAPHCRSTLNIDRRPKSASNILIANQHSLSSSHKQNFQQSSNKNSHTKMHRSEDDLILAMQRNQEEIIEPEQPNVRELTTQFEQKTNPLTRSRTIDIRIINNDKQQQQEDDDELSWPQQPISINSSTQTNGIKKFVRNSLKLFITQPQQHKRTGK